MRSQQFAALVSQQPANTLFRFSLAQALLNEGRPAEALPHLETCARSRADWMVPRILLGKTLASLGRPADARPWLAEALKLAIEQSHEDPERDLRELLAELGEEPDN